MNASHTRVPYTAVVPAAGLGTRFLPATKTVPKELLPVVDTPGIELVAAEAAEAGAGRLVIVTSPGKDGVVAPERAPSRYAAAGRYLLDRAIFDALRATPRGAGGEVQLTDAIALLIDDGHPVHVVVHRGSRRDLGNRGGYLKASVDLALDREDYGPELLRWLPAQLAMAEIPACEGDSAVAAAASA